MPTAIIVWKAQWVMLTGGRVSTENASSPSAGSVSELRAMIDPRYGLSIAHRTSPSMRRPPSRSGDGLSVSTASSKAANFSGCHSASRPPSK